MSAELLRRAAGTLRVAAAAATEGPWSASAVDSPDALVTSAIYSLAHPTGTTESEVVAAVKKGKGNRGLRLANDARYIAMMSPPVALALAALIDAEAKREEWHIAEFGYRIVPNELHALARAILREAE